MCSSDSNRVFTIASDDSVRTLKDKIVSGRFQSPLSREPVVCFFFVDVFSAYDDGSDPWVAGPEGELGVVYSIDVPSAQSTLDFVRFASSSFRTTIPRWLRSIPVVSGSFSY